VVIDKGEHDPARGSNMKLFVRHDTQARRPRQRGRRAILIAVAVAAVAVALAWLIFNAVLRFVTLD
jgi:ferric-dicitrate binding protein FerR (iron transport regulator)